MSILGLVFHFSLLAIPTLIFLSDPAAPVAAILDAKLPAPSAEGFLTGVPLARWVKQQCQDWLRRNPVRRETRPTSTAVRADRFESRIRVAGFGVRPPSPDPRNILG